MVHGSRLRRRIVIDIGIGQLKTFIHLSVYSHDENDHVDNVRRKAHTLRKRQLGPGQCNGLFGGIEKICRYGSWRCKPQLNGHNQRTLSMSEEDAGSSDATS